MDIEELLYSPYNHYFWKPQLENFVRQTGKCFYFTCIKCGHGMIYKQPLDISYNVVMSSEETIKSITEKVAAELQVALNSKVDRFANLVINNTTSNLYDMMLSQLEQWGEKGKAEELKKNRALQEKEIQAKEKEKLSCYLVLKIYKTTSTPTTDWKKFYVKEQIREWIVADADKVQNALIFEIQFDRLGLISIGLIDNSIA